MFPTARALIAHPTVRTHRTVIFSSSLSPPPPRSLLYDRPLPTRSRFPPLPETSSFRSSSHVHLYSLLCISGSFRPFASASLPLSNRPILEVTHEANGVVLSVGEVV